MGYSIVLFSEGRTLKQPYTPISQFPQLYHAGPPLGPHGNLRESDQRQIRNSTIESAAAVVSATSASIITPVTQTTKSGLYNLPAWYLRAMFFTYLDNRGSLLRVSVCQSHIYHYSFKLHNSSLPRVSTVFNVLVCRYQ